NQSRQEIGAGREKLGIIGETWENEGVTRRIRDVAGWKTCPAVGILRYMAILGSFRLKTARLGRFCLLASIAVACAGCGLETDPRRDTKSTAASSNKAATDKATT